MKKLLLLFAFLALSNQVTANTFLTRDDIIGGEQVDLLAKSAVGHIVHSEDNGSVTCPVGYMLAGLMQDQRTVSRGKVHWSKGGFLHSANMVYCTTASERMASGCRGLDIRHIVPVRVMCIKKCE